MIKPRTVLIVGLLALLACGDDDGAAGSMLMPGMEFGNAEDLVGGGRAGSGVASDGSEGEFEGACPEGLVQTSRVVPRVILVLDGSCSMSTEYGAAGPSAMMCRRSPTSRWGALRDALLNPQTGVVTTLQHTIEFGLVIFGTQRQCPIPGDPIQPAVNNGGAIEAAFPQEPPGLYTPTGPALDWVYNNMITGEMLDSNMGPQIVLLATDGEPNSCDDATPRYQPSVDAVMLGRSVGATTYVISLANSTGEFHDHLQELADIGAGGAGTLYEPTSASDLSAALSSLIGNAVGCEIALNGSLSPNEACSGTVALNGRALQCNTEWELAETGRHIRLLGDLCGEFQSSPAAQLTADFPCMVFRPD